MIKKNINVPINGNKGEKNVNYFKVSQVEKFFPSNLEIMHVMDEEYVSDELYSGDDDLDCDGDPKPKYLKFGREELRKDFQFKLGMEFSSLAEFKEVILEHSVLNGKELKICEK